MYFLQSRPKKTDKFSAPRSVPYSYTDFRLCMDIAQIMSKAWYGTQVTDSTGTVYLLIIGGPLG